jgi:hypothetical protein
MRFVPIDSVTEEVVLARNVPSERPDGAPLLRSGARVGDSMVKRIAGLGISGVWIDDELGRDIEPPPEFPGDVLGIALHAVTRAIDAAPRAAASKQNLDAKIVRGLQEAAGDIADAVLSYPGQTCPISDLPVSVATPPWHAVRVAVLGTFIGRRVLTKSGWIDYQGVQRFDGFDERLSTLALGLLAHDIGAMPSAVGPWMTPEHEQDAEHVNRAAFVSHHERWDGLGYPDRKCGDATALNARIAAIADGYDALVATGGDRAPVPVHAAVQAIGDEAGGRFEPAMVAHLKALVPPYPIGHELRLPDRRSGVVVKLPPGDGLRPTIRLHSASGPIVELVADLTSPGLVGRVAA